MRKLGNTDFEITPVGFGTWAIGGEWVYGWGPQDDADSVAAIVRAVNLGINWIDTAAAYGLGHSEEICARAFNELGSSRKPYIFTKCSLVWDSEGRIGHSLRSDSIRREAEASLRRLKVDAIDLYQIHWPSFPPGNPDDPDIEEGWSTLAELQKEGKVRHIGVSNFSVAQLKRIHRLAPVSSLQPPYSMLMRGIEDEILPFCEANNIGVIVYSPMHNGLLSGSMTRERVQNLPENDWRRRNPAFIEPALTKNLEVAEVLKAIGVRHGRTAGEVAIAWTLRLSAVTGAIVGGRSPKQVEGFAGALEFRLTPEEIDEIDAVLPAPLPFQV